MPPDVRVTTGRHCNYKSRLRWLGHVEKKTEDDVAMRTWKRVVRERKATKTEVKTSYKNTYKRQEN